MMDDLKAKIASHEYKAKLDVRDKFVALLLVGKYKLLIGVS